MLLLDEFRKYRSFKEAYIGWLMAMALFLFITVVAPADYGEWYVFQQGVFDTTLCIGIVVIMGVSRLFCYEREVGCGFFVKTSKHGHRHTFTRKIIVAVCICATAVSVFGVLNLICSIRLADPERLEILDAAYGGFHDKMTTFYFYRGEMTDIVRPDGSIAHVKIGDVPQMTNAAYYVLQYVFMFISYLYFAGFIMLVSVLTKSTSATVATSGGLFALSMYYHLNYFNVYGRAGFDWLYRLSFGGFVFHDSFSWYTERWSDVWKPIVFCLCATAVQFLLLWLLWRRRERT